MGCIIDGMNWIGGKMKCRIGKTINCIAVRFDEGYRSVEDLRRCFSLVEVTEKVNRTSYCHYKLNQPFKIVTRKYLVKKKVLDKMYGTVAERLTV